jgi:hypothetical protein
VRTVDSETRFWIARAATWLVFVVIVLVLGWRAVVWIGQREEGDFSLWVIGVIVFAGLFLIWRKRWADF